MCSQTEEVIRCLNDLFVFLVLKTILINYQCKYPTATMYFFGYRTLNQRKWSLCLCVDMLTQSDSSIQSEYSNIHTHKQVYIYVCMYVCMYVCVCVCTSILYTSSWDTRFPMLLLCQHSILQN
jgi:hypothetical protein